jgi:hypothetical protein
MNTSKKPSAEEFEKAVQAAGGNLSTVARAFKVRRNTINDWRRADPEFDLIVKNDRRAIYDSALATARVLALGIPAYETDENGNKRLAGWIERPSERMVQLLLSKYSDEDGFGVNEDGMTPLNGVSIKAWIQRMNNSDSDD